MNVSDPSSIRSCTSCQMCAAICPREAIRIEWNKDGFYRPLMDGSKCVECGLCMNVCYKFDSGLSMTSPETLAQKPLYAAVAQDNRLMAETTSGGIADLLAEELIKEGYACIGVSYNEERSRAEHTVANTREETFTFRGSKYMQSFSLPAFREMVQNCTHRRYALFGLPCQIYAVHRYLLRRKLRDRFILIDLYCHGCPSFHAWRKYAREVKRQIGKDHFGQVKFRSKVNGWGNFCVEIMDNGVQTFVSSPEKDEFYTLFFSNNVLNEACHDCRLRSTLDYCDIRLGDFWGRKYAANSQGISAVSLSTERGLYVFEKIRKKTNVIKQHPYADLLPYQSWGKTYHPDPGIRRQMLEALSHPDKPLAEAVRIFYRNQHWKGRLKRYAKHAARYLPFDAISLLKRFLPIL